MSKLERLDLWETKVTEEGVTRLRQAAPNVNVIRQKP
jgi:hypothetical protein